MVENVLSHTCLRYLQVSLVLSISPFISSGTNNFFSNSAERSGDAIYAGYNTSLRFIGISGFSQNSAERYGGAIVAYEYVVLTFRATNNSANSVSGGAIYAESNIRLNFIGTNDFSHNTAEHYGGAIEAHCTYIQWNQQLFSKQL